VSKEAVSNNVGTSGRKEIPSQERAIKWFEEEKCNKIKMKEKTSDER
jgi:hypothetical protein